MKNGPVSHPCQGFHSQLVLQCILKSSRSLTRSCNTLQFYKSLNQLLAQQYAQLQTTQRLRVGPVRRRQLTPHSSPTASERCKVAGPCAAQQQHWQSNSPLCQCSSSHESAADLLITSSATFYRPNTHMSYKHHELCLPLLSPHTTTNYWRFPYLQQLGWIIYNDDLHYGLQNLLKEIMSSFI